MAPKRGGAAEPTDLPAAERRVTRGSSKKNPAPELPAPPPRKRAKPVPNGEDPQRQLRRKKKAEREEEEAVGGVEASVKDISIDHSPAEGCDEELRNKKKAEKKEEEVVDGVGASANSIVIEHCKQCNSFKKRAEMVVDGLKKRVQHVIVKINPSKPRRGCFEIRDEDGHTFVSLLDMPRPFTKMKALDMEKLIEEIASFIKSKDED